MRTCWGLVLLISFYGSFVLAAPALKLVEFKNPPVVGQTLRVNPTNASQIVNSDPVYYGGFSGLLYDGSDAGGRGHLFKINSDRGPNAETIDFIPGTFEAARPFVVPSFVPRVMGFLVNFDDGTATLISDLEFAKGDGYNVSGLPNLQYQEQGLAFTDEFGVDLFGNVLSNDPYGADLEGVVIADDGTYWLGDEYRPSIFHFDSQGKLLKRYIPDGQPTATGNYGVPILPSVYAQRRYNRGFEGVALDKEILYAFLQSPLDNPNTEKNTVSKNSSNIRILAFDTVNEKVVAEYVYVLSEGSRLSGDSKVDKIGDVASLGNGKFLVIEQDSRAGKDAYKAIFEIDISGASNVNDPKVLANLPPNTTLEQVVLDKNINIIPVTKRFIINVATLGFEFAKLEGIAVFNSTSVVIVNDNDFQVGGSEITANGTVAFNRSASSYFGLVTGLNFTSSYVTTSTTYFPTTQTASTTSEKTTTGSTGDKTTTGGSTGEKTTTGNFTTTADTLTTGDATTGAATTGAATTGKGSTTRTTSSSTTSSASSVVICKFTFLFAVIVAMFITI